MPEVPPAASHADPRAEAWFAAQGWAPFDFQRQVWAAMQAGRSGMLHATTGSGKTLAVWIGALLRRCRPPPALTASPSAHAPARRC